MTKSDSESEMGIFSTWNVYFLKLYKECSILTCHGNIVVPKLYLHNAHISDIFNIMYFVVPHKCGIFIHPPKNSVTPWPPRLSRPQMVQPTTSSAHADGWFSSVVSGHADRCLGPLHQPTTMLLNSARSIRPTLVAEFEK